MLYSSISILAILIELIVNQDVLFGKNQREKEIIPAQKRYRRFLIATLAYFLTDALWGILNDAKLLSLLYIDTIIYFVAMAAGILLWTQYVIRYLDDKNIFSDFLMYTGQIFFAYELIFLVVNNFHPVFFYFDESGNYQAGYVRYISLFLQIGLFMLSSAYTFYEAVKTSGASRRRYYTIGLFGISMAVFIAIQYFYPLLPIYAMGYMLGCCLLHTYVVEDVKDEYRKELEEALAREREQKKELGSARRLAYTDSLTGVKSKHAYIEKEEELDQRISDKVAGEFGVVVFDLNGLKQINDTKGHDTGDDYIRSASGLICDSFKRSPVYRIGGDEFVAILEGEDYRDRAGILGAFDMKMEKNLRSDRVVIATGMSEYDPARDSSYRSIFERADAIMYQRKKILKETGVV